MPTDQLTCALPDVGTKNAPAASAAAAAYLNKEVRFSVGY
jgi:hypothetical protein